MLNLIRSDIAVAAPEPSTETVARALATLTPSDLVRLKRLAQLRARLLPGLEWDELLNEALLRALDGSRRWPEGVPLLTFLAGIMRSLVDRRVHERRRLANTRSRVARLARHRLRRRSSTPANVWRRSHSSSPPIRTCWR